MALYQLVGRIALTLSTLIIALKGRFLHITDIHPDPYYKTGATFESGCHSKPKKERGKSKGKGKLDEDASAIDVEGEEVDEDMFDDKEDLAGRWGSGVS